MNLKNRFIKLLAIYTSDEVLIASLWNTVVVHYSQKHRAYHNLNHLTELFNYFDTYNTPIEKPNNVSFAIFYHDIIYNIWKKDNEERSADFAITQLKNIVNEIDLKEIHTLILATKTHKATTNDAKWLIDFDLAIFGQSVAVYDEYTSLIRKEYKVFPFFIYKRERRKIIRHFINKSSIFTTKTFVNLFEEKAKNNLKTELKSL